jgi:hypothetical protein
MIVFNTTFLVSDAYLEIFLDWAKNQHIPRMMETSYFNTPRFYKILAQQEKGSTSYSLQFESQTVEQINEWEEKYQQELLREMALMFEENVLSFSTLLEVL